MRFVMKSGDMIANRHVDAIERVGDVIYAYRKGQTASEFAGMFDLGAVDFIYTTPEGRSE